MLPYPAVSLSLWELLCVPYSEEPDHLNSLFPIWAKHMPTQYINIMFMTKLCFFAGPNISIFAPAPFLRKNFSLVQ